MSRHSLRPRGSKIRGVRSHRRAAELSPLPLPGLCDSVGECHRCGNVIRVGHLTADLIVCESCGMRLDSQDLRSGMAPPLTLIDST
jgi:hypothetical protein